jgi:lysine-specific demethylase 8
MAHARDALALILDDAKTLSDTPGASGTPHQIQCNALPYLHCDNPDITSEWLSFVLTAVPAIQRSADLQESLDGWRQRSHARMPQSKDASELWCCRKVYTDACILAAVVQEMHGDPLKAVETLDHALIIAGDSRMDVIHNLIQSLQASLPPRACHTDAGAYSAISDSPCTHPLSSSSLTIPRISPPSFLAFQSLHSKQPFIVADYARDWPALNEHPWRRASYLRSVSGPGRVVPVEVGNNYLLETWKQVIMSWDSFLASLEFEDQEPSGGGELFYLAQHNLFMQMPALQDDFTVPDYAYASLVSDGRTHVPPSNENQLVINSWLGPRGTVSPPHTVSSIFNMGNGD